MACTGWWWWCFVIASRWHPFASPLQPRLSGGLHGFAWGSLPSHVHQGFEITCCKEDVELERVLAEAGLQGGCGAGVLTTIICNQMLLPNAVLAQAPIQSTNSAAVSLYVA